MLQGMVLALAIVLICTSMLLIYRILRDVERRLERRERSSLWQLDSKHS
jgi:heme exporter protein D